MYIIAPQFIRDYITRNFATIGKLSACGREFIMQSLFVEDDWKKHMSVNVDSGLWQCFKTGRSGNFTTLYAKAEGLQYFWAQKDLIIKNFRFLGEDIPELDRPNQAQELELDTSKLVPINLSTVESNDQTELDAWSFLFGRALFSLVEEEESPFYLCKEGKFANRIIIPFKGDADVVYYFQARALYDQTPKYLNPSTDTAPKPSDILYPFDEEDHYVVVCEGPLDALSLQLKGINATATIGSSVSTRQAEILSTFDGTIILGYDNDVAGQRGIDKFDRTRKEMRMEAFEVCHPPSGYKDWNEAHVAGEDLFSWITNESQAYDFEYKLKLSLAQ
jgi:DNA primase